MRVIFLALGLVIGAGAAYVALRGGDLGLGGGGEGAATGAALPEEAVLEALMAQGAAPVANDGCFPGGSEATDGLTVAGVMARLVRFVATREGNVSYDCGDGQCTLAMVTEGPERDKGSGNALRWAVGADGAMDPASFSCIGY